MESQQTEEGRKVKVPGFNSSVQNIYFDRSPRLRRLAELKAKSLGFNLIVPATDPSCLERENEQEALNEFLAALPTFEKGSAFYISSHFVQDYGSVHTGKTLARRIKKQIKGAKVYFVTAIHNGYQAELEAGVIDGIFSKELINRMPFKIEKLSNEEQGELNSLASFYESSF